MVNSELELLELQGLRFCRMDYATKGPRYANWQDSPYLLQEIPANGNVGVITGIHSNGLLAIDFDGPWSWDKATELGLELPDTICWSSGREGRAQFGLFVPKVLWGVMRTFKINGPDDSAGHKQQLEFRWSGVQSVLPPSMHPDTGNEYQWLNAPSDTLIAEAPLDLLEWMLNYAPPVEHVETAIEQIDLSNLTVDKLNEVETVLKQIKQHEPTLGYDDWIRVTWAVASHIGTSAGVAVMQAYWPEAKQGEYTKLLRGFSIERSPKFGSLVHRIAQHNAPKKTTKQTFGANKKTLRMSF